MEACAWIRRLCGRWRTFFPRFPILAASEACGIRFPGMLALVFLGLLARIRELARLQDWAARHWDELQEPARV